MPGIELHTSRRNRLNGTVHRTQQDGFDVRVGQSYGNCPQYIQRRDFDFARDPMERSGYDPVHFDSLDGRPAEMIAKADTFFVASYVDREDGERQIDVSHRGGRPGFVRIGEDGVLTIPDFAGNLFFNTLGNILANPLAGLVFADFEAGDLLQLSGDAQVILESPEIGAFQGAERLWRFRPTQIVYRQEASPLRWRPRTDGASPNSLMTGSWNEAAARLRATAVAKSWRPFRVARIVQESASVRSFYLEPTDAGGILPHVSGQHSACPHQGGGIAGTRSAHLYDLLGALRWYVSHQRQARGTLSRRVFTTPSEKVTSSRPARLPVRSRSTPQRDALPFCWPPALA